MKTRFSFIAVVLLLLASSLPALAQMATVKGVAKDQQGNPIVGATVEMTSHENGRKFTLKTDKKGEFMSIGVSPGAYKVTLSKDGQQIWESDGFRVSLAVESNFLDLDLQHKQQEALQGKGLTPEQKKELEEAQKKNEAATKENVKISGLNTFLSKAKAAHDANNDTEAIAQMKQATEAGPNYDQTWGILSTYQLSAKQYEDAAESAKKAVEIATNSTDPKAKARLGSWQNTLGQAYTHIKGHGDDAVAAYDAAAQSDPTNAAMYYFNMGAVLTNTGKVDQANVAFDKAIAADPTKADAYYQKAVNLMQKATLDPSGKIIPAQGTAENLNKYLELQPTGPHAEEAKQLLATMGEKVQTSYGTKTKKK
jgi:tetratricopeptide (TPR) repeat protein